MTEPKRNSAWWLLFLAVILSAVFFGKAYSQHECQGGHNCNDGGEIDNILTGGDNTASISGGRSYGVGGADYDIGQCMYHVGGLTVAVGLRNKFCEGMDMIRSGMVDAGILHICKQTKIGRNYDNLKDCQDGLAIVYIDLPKKDTQDDLSISEPTQDDEDDNRYDALYSRMASYEEHITKAEDNTKKAAQRADAVAVRARQEKQREQRTAQQDLEAYREIISE